MTRARIAECLRREQIVAAAYDVAVRQGLRGVTIRDVARKGGMSAGLVIFHFRTKDRLVLALLDWVLENTISLEIPPDIATIASPQERIMALVRQEVTRIAREPKRNRLFFELWSEAVWNRAVRTRMQRDLDRYRAAFLPFVRDLLAAEPARFHHVSAAALTTALVSFIKGCAVQSTIEPDLDLSNLLRATEGVLAIASSPRAAAVA